jgi:hypothetical protein
MFSIRFIAVDWTSSLKTTYIFEQAAPPVGMTAAIRISLKLLLAARKRRQAMSNSKAMEERHAD